MNTVERMASELTSLLQMHPLVATTGFKKKNILREVLESSSHGQVVNTSAVGSETK